MQAVRSVGNHARRTSTDLPHPTMCIVARGDRAIREMENGPYGLNGKKSAEQRFVLVIIVRYGGTGTVRVRLRKGEDGASALKRPSWMKGIVA